MNRGDQNKGADAPPSRGALLAFGLFALAVALTLAMLAPFELAWKSGREITRQPGFFAVLSIVGMLVFGLFWLTALLRARTVDNTQPWSAEIISWCRAMEFALWFLFYVLVVPKVGYLPTSILFCLLLTFRLGYRSPKMLTLSALFAICTVIVFKSFLAVKIPGGALYELLPDSVRNFMILYL